MWLKGYIEESWLFYTASANSGVITAVLEYSTTCSRYDAMLSVGIGEGVLYRDLRFETQAMCGLWRAS